jgi:hypothetical protein
MDDGYACVTEESATYTRLLHLETFEESINDAVWHEMREGPKI